MLYYSNEGDTNNINNIINNNNNNNNNNNKSSCYNNNNIKEEGCGFCVNKVCYCEREDFIGDEEDSFMKVLTLMRKGSSSVASSPSLSFNKSSKSAPDPLMTSKLKEFLNLENRPTPRYGEAVLRRVMSNQTSSAGFTSPVSSRVPQQNIALDISTNPPWIDDEALGNISHEDRRMYLPFERERRRVSPSYRKACADFGHDLKIVLPIEVPNYTIAVDCGLGSSYYGIQGEFVDRTREHAVQVLFGKNQDEIDSLNSTVRQQSAYDHDFVDPTYSGVDHGCSNTWASFLNIELGTVYNVGSHQIKIVVLQFREISRQLAGECKSLNFTASGIYPMNNYTGVEITDPRELDRLAPNQVTYFTKLALRSHQDLNSYLRIRYLIKSFAKNLGYHFGDPTTARAFDVHWTDKPPMNCKLSHNLCNHHLMIGNIKVPVRMQSTSTISSKLKDFIFSWNNNEYVNLTKDLYNVYIEASELRLEHEKQYMIDPRWPSELILCRRIAFSAESLNLLLTDEELITHVASSYNGGRIVFDVNARKKQNINFVYMRRFQSSHEAVKLIAASPTTRKINSADRKKFPSKEIKKLVCKSPLGKVFAQYLKVHPNLYYTNNKNFNNIREMPQALPAPTPSSFKNLVLDASASEFTPSRSSSTKTKSKTKER